MFNLIIFDLDETLAPSKSPIDDEMLFLIKSLLEKYKVWIISGRDYSQFEKTIIPQFDNTFNLSNLYIWPTCWSKLYSFNWEYFEKLYSEDLKDFEKDYIKSVLNKAIEDLDYYPEKAYGELIEDRWSQITYSALWQDAPQDLKRKYDPDFSKRLYFRNYILKDLQEYSISIWWATWIDITKTWLDKAYWVKKLSEILKIDMLEILFVWDAVFPWWNDYSPLDTYWITTKKVFSIEDTKNFIKILLK